MSTKQWALASNWGKDLQAALKAADERELTERAIAFSEANIPDGEEPQITKTGVIVALFEMGHLI